MYEKERLKVVMLSIEKIHSTTSRYAAKKKKKVVSVNLKSYIYWTKKEIIGNNFMLEISLMIHELFCL